MRVSASVGERASTENETPVLVRMKIKGIWTLLSEYQGEPLFRVKTNRRLVNDLILLAGRKALKIIIAHPLLVLRRD